MPEQNKRAGGMLRGFSEDDLMRISKKRRLGLQARIKVRRNQSAKLYLEGVRVSEIAEQLGVGPSMIYEDLKAKGIARINDRGKYRAIKQKRMRETVSLHQEGYSGYQIAKIIGVSRATVQNYLKEKGVISKFIWKPMSRNPDQLERIRSLHIDHDWTCEEIGWMIGLSSPGVAHRLKSIGVEPRGLEIIRDRKMAVIRRRRERVRYYYEEKGENLNFIAYNLGISWSTLRKDLVALKEEGLKRPDGWEHPWKLAAQQSARLALHRNLGKVGSIHRKAEKRRLAADGGCV